MSFDQSWDAWASRFKAWNREYADSKINKIVSENNLKTIQEWNALNKKVKKNAVGYSKYFAEDQVEDSYFIKGRKDRKKLISKLNRSKRNKDKCFRSHKEAVIFLRKNPGWTIKKRNSISDRPYIASPPNFDEFLKKYP